MKITQHRALDNVVIYHLFFVLYFLDVFKLLKMKIPTGVFH